MGGVADSDDVDAQYDALSEKDRRRVAEFMQLHAGIQLPAAKHSLVESRLRKRQRKLGFRYLRDYIDHVLVGHQGEHEKVHFLDALTTNKTEFYRESDHFEFIRKDLNRELSLNPDLYRNRPYKAWSAGCSSGEEPYTLAIELLEVQRQHPAFRFEILATDISLSCLSVAKKGVYPHGRIEPIAMALRKRYLLRSRNQNANLVRMADEVRQSVRFESFNLLTDSFESKRAINLIFCRNVMIYFNHQDRASIINRFAQCLTSKGVFIVGHSETLGEGVHAFERIKPTIFRVCHGGSLWKK